MLLFGPKTKEEKLDDEAIAIIEAYQEAEEYLEHGFTDFDLSIFETID